MKKRVAVLFGGASSEHDVSLVSASSVIKNIPADKYDVFMLGITKEGRWFLYEGSPENLPEDMWLQIGSRTPAFIAPDSSDKGIVVLKEAGCERIPIDVVFPVLHGKNGEDGTIQGLLQLAGIPFVGCDTAASAICMDKVLTNTLLDHAGILHAKWLGINAYEYNKAPVAFIEKAEAYLGYPIFVKPANAGSSVGITKAHDRSELYESIRMAFKYDKKLIFEESVDGYEVECAVLGNDEPIASVVGEIVPCNEFYDYDAKYVANATKLLIPASISPEKQEEVRALAIHTYKTLGCAGLARVDFFVLKSDGTVLLNEPNTIPGFTSISMYPKLFEAYGISYPELIHKLLDYAMENAF